MPLDELLLELNDIIEFEMLLVDREAEKRPVTAEIEDELVKDALLEILEAAKVNGIVMGEGTAFRMYAGSSAVMGSGRNVRSLLEEDSGGDAPVANSRQVGPRQRRRQPGQRERQRRAATGDAALVVTGDAWLSSRPETSRLAGVFVLLWTGMLGGWVLVGGRGRL